MELEDTEILTQKSVTGSSDTALERIVNQTITDTSILPPFISKLDVNTGLSGISAIPFVDTVGADDANFTVGSTKVSKSKDFTTAEVTTETIEDAVTEVGIDSTIQNILDIQTVKKIEASILEALNSDSRIHYSMSPSWAGIHEGILELGSDIYSIVGTIYVAVSLPVYLNLIENEDENLVNLLGSKLKLVIMEGFTNSQLLIVHEYGVAGGIGVKNIEKERKPGLDRVDYTAPFTHSFGWDPRFIRFSGALYSRYFRRNEGTTDYATIPEVTLASAFDLSVTLSTIDTGVVSICGEFNNGFNNYIALNVGGVDLQVRINNTSVDFNAPSINDGNLHSLLITRDINNVVSASLDGTQLIGGGTLAGDAVMDLIYANNIPSNHFDGILANLKIWDNGTLIRDYPLNDNSNVLANRATSLGQEIWDTTGSFDGAIGTINGESLIIEATVPYGRYEISNRGLAGTEFLINFTVSNSVGDNVVVNTYNALNQADTLIQPLRFGNGDHEVLTNLTDFDRCQFRLESTGNEVTISNISIRRADGYGTIINGNADDWGLFDKQANGDWLGQELVVNGGFDNDSDWVKSAGWSISGGEAIYDGLNGTQSLAQNPVPLVEGASYILSLVVLDNSGSGLNTVFLGDSNTISSSHLPVGEYSFNGSAIISRNVSIFGRANEVFAIDNVSVREVLKNA